MSSSVRGNDTYSLSEGSADLKENTKGSFRYRYFLSLLSARKAEEG